MGLHGCDTGEDFEKLVVAFWGHLAEEEELVHCDKIQKAGVDEMRIQLLVVDVVLGEFDMWRLQHRVNKEHYIKRLTTMLSF